MPKKSMADVSDGDLLSTLSDSKKELFNLRFQHATGQLDNTARLKEVKKTIAQVNTEVRSREIAAAETLELAGEDS